MDWILNHIWVVVVIAGLVTRALQAVRGNTSATKKTAEPSRRQEYVDAEQAERTRKIREEIQRKIAERRGPGAAPPAPEPARPRLRVQDRSPEATTPPSVLELPPMVRKVFGPAPAVEPTPIPVEAVTSSAELARQAALADQLRQVIARKTAEERRATFASSLADQQQVALLVNREALLDDLHDPEALRRAFILREVLGPPMAMRN
jgi:hypothetical protein